MNDKEQTDHKAINLMLPAILQAITTDFPKESIIKHQTKLKHYLTFQFDRSEYVGAQAYESRLYILIINLYSDHKINFSRR